ncbi:unnamed protein product [Camellia sinensis]
MMSLGDNASEENKTTLSSPRQSPVAVITTTTTTKKGKSTTSTARIGRCRGLIDCIVMGSTVSVPQPHQHTTPKLEQQGEEHFIEDNQVIQLQELPPENGGCTTHSWRDTNQQSNKKKKKNTEQRYTPKTHSYTELTLKSNGLQKVAELEKEVQKQKELRAIYQRRLERTQEYLRYCLQMAQENGFLDTITNNKDIIYQEKCLISFNIMKGSASLQTPPPPPVLVHHNHHHHGDLVTLINQAKTSGWYVEQHEIELHGKVAQGSTAEIYKATWRGLDVAVKWIYPDFFHSNENGVSFFAQEVEMLSRQRHCFVLQLMGACLDPPNHSWIVTEFFSTTLREWLHGPDTRRKERVVPLPSFEERVAKALEIAQAMQYLHEHKPKVIHRDLKPSNIFLDDTMHVRVADFGHARLLTDEEKALTGETGTYVYMAPEVIRCEPYNEKCDVYSFGIILNELITGEHPFIETDYGPSKIAMEVAEGSLRPTLPKGDDHQLKDLIDLIQLSWDEDLDIRPSFALITRSLKIIQGRLVDSLQVYGSTTLNQPCAETYASCKQCKRDFGQQNKFNDTQNYGI